MIKFNVLRGNENIEKLNEDISDLLNRDEDVLEKYILSSLEFKKRYIEEDEFDYGARVHLNYAHTFGHAIESVTKYDVPHGTAVAMGMIVANNISTQRGMLEECVAYKIENLVSRIINIKFDFNGIIFSDIVKAIRKDKKQVDNNICAILLDENMLLQTVHDVTEDEMKNGFKHLIHFLEDVEDE